MIPVFKPLIEQAEIDAEPRRLSKWDGSAWAATSTNSRKLSERSWVRATGTWRP